jgi:hypothetical protein
MNRAIINKFNTGDRIRCITDVFHFYRGDECVVLSNPSIGSYYVNVTNDNTKPGWYLKYDEDRFELVSSAKESKQFTSWGF